MGSTSGLHDDPLIGGTECVEEAGQRGLDQPRFKGHPCGLAVGIKFLGHSQRLQYRGHAPSSYQDDGGDFGFAHALALRGFLDCSQGCTRCGPVTFKPAFCELEQEGFGRRDLARCSSFADGHHLA
jgi:hypothetical protein